ncbi:TIGR01777 family oxidoreductase [Texcoconibacillus texcoconensis]|uniref:TIGR01777 family protein n=1 Tax=Texcoconibacillus texcoconensis TaxID=1095777 RepID=A0A840QTP3_9BACI|nr:TIGR01777 family oxidoreductase [Texcoconibacillus texcoconensis]MBB5174637.1 hypothetical protein [Texcoconibacillus texcoconensis]
MSIVIAGGSGFIGAALTNELLANGEHVYILTRNKQGKQEQEGVTYVEWLHEQASPEKEIKNPTAIVNLAGESLNEKRWTTKQKQRILTSRTESTRAICLLIDKLESKPDVLVNASAIGFYGTSFNETFTEETTNPGDDFLAHVVSKWETEASKATEHVRVVYARLGIVLDKDEGALSKMLLPFQLFAGGRLGTGKQWMSWVHINDVVKMIQFAINHSSVQGPLNVTAPNPVKMETFTQNLASVLKRPNWFPVPEPLLKAALGEMSTLVLDGQRVLPEKAMNDGYTFQFTDLQPALKNLL